MKIPKYTICTDTICTGYAPILEGESPVQYATEIEAQKEIDNDLEFYEDCFACPIDEIGHKTIYKGQSNATI